MQLVARVVVIEMNHDLETLEGPDTQPRRVEDTELSMGDEHHEIRLHQAGEIDDVTVVGDRRAYAASSFDQADLDLGPVNPISPASSAMAIGGRPRASAAIGGAIGASYQRW